jgi:hypothetical protein
MMAQALALAVPALEVNGPEDQALNWDAIDWRDHEDQVRRLSTGGRSNDIAWLFGYRRLTVRYERKGSHFLACPGLAAILVCYKKLAKLAT